MIYDVLQDKRGIILKVAVKNGIHNVRVFGSVSRLKDGPSSDLDLLVDFEDWRSLFDLIRFKQEIEARSNGPLATSVSENTAKKSKSKKRLFRRMALFPSVSFVIGSPLTNAKSLNSQ